MKIYHGFTLIEMAVVLVIIGLLIGGLLIPFSEQLNQKRLEATQQRLEEIKEALIGFAIIDGRLPCPDTYNDGIEDNPAACNTEGDLPWATLALDARSHSSDAWGTPFRYRIDKRYTTQPFPNPPNTSSGLKVQDTQQPTPLSLVAPETNGTSRVIAIIFSYGKDGQPYDENGTTDNKYAQDVYVENKFDDMLIWLPKSILINRLVAAGKWPPNN
jgi:prepilin-type N-terminal cleavage/methylation domain-containing protein